MFPSSPKLKNFASQQLLKGTLSQKNIQNEIIPTTPSKCNNIVKNLKFLNGPSQTDSSFRSSNSKRILTQESPYVNKENTLNIEQQYKLLQLENKKLTELVQRLFKEKQDLINQTNDFLQLKQRVERLELIIDQQTDEIEEWKQKYQDICQNEQTIDKNSHQNIILEEKERLYEANIQLNERINSLEQIIKDLEYKVTDQNNQIIAYEEEKIQLQEQLNSLMKNPNYNLESILLDISLIEKSQSLIQQQQIQKSLQNEKIKLQIEDISKTLQVFQSSQNVMDSQFDIVNQMLDQMKKKITN